MRLRQTVNAYLAMKVILCAVRVRRKQPGIEVVAVPGLRTGCGALPAATVALQRWTSWQEIILGLGVPGERAEFGES